MKKNKTLRLAAALLILTLLTTGIISGTFAKYVTEGSAKDTARVAKWGVTVTTSGSLYSNAYAGERGGNVPHAWDAESISEKAVTVATKTVAEDNIVAPGTESYGEGLSFGITGTPEVAVKVGITVKAEDIFLKTGTYGVLVPVTVSDTVSLREVIAENTGDNKGVYDETYTKLAEDATYTEGKTYYVLTSVATVDTNGYYPVKYALEGVTGTKATDIALGLAQKIANGTSEKAATNGYVEYTGIENTYPANTNLATTIKLSEQKISWAWEYENTNADTAKKNNAADTVLGDLIAARGATVDYKVVSVDATAGTVTVLTISDGTDDYTVTDGTGVVANLRTKVDIKLSVTQVD